MKIISLDRGSHDGLVAFETGDVLLIPLRPKTATQTWSREHDMHAALFLVAWEAAKRDAVTRNEPRSA